MLWIIRFLGFVFQAVALEFIHLFGFVVFLIVVPIGYFRAPWWSVPPVAIISGLIAHNFVDHVYLTTIFDRVVSAANRGAFVMIVYFAITFGGYLTGLLISFFVKKRKKAQTSR